MDKLVIITGPTATGKSALSVRLAQRLQGEVISADSMQVYRMMDIGSAKITKEEMGGIRHHLIDCVDPSEDFNVYRFKKMAGDATRDILSRGKLPIIAGGTGFYIQAVLYDIDFAEEEGSKEYRLYLEELLSKEGPRRLHEILEAADPLSAEIIHENNSKRVIRALEYYHVTGERISAHNAEMRQKTSPYDFRYYVLNMPRAEIYRRIDERVDRMLEAGLVQEVRGLMALGLTDRNVSMQGLGYKEIYAYLKGELDYDEAIRIIKRDTRHFAKRQLTWFKRERDVRMIELGDFGYDEERVIEHIIEDIG